MNIIEQAAANIAEPPRDESGRVANDDYPTPEPFAREMLYRIGAALPYVPKMVLEPSAGSGTFVRVAREIGIQAPIVACEINPAYQEHLYAAGANMVSIGSWPDIARAIDRATTPPGPWLIVGNPPFVNAQEHIEEALRIMQPGEWLAFLLRINFFGSAGRRDFWNRKKDRLRYLIPFCERPKFRVNKNGKKGTDPTEYGCFIWQKGWTDNAEILPNLSVAAEVVREGGLEE